MVNNGIIEVVFNNFWYFFGSSDKCVVVYDYLS